MATKPKESTAQPKTKSSSAPSTPRSSDNANGKSKFTNSSEVDTTPHYLKPTISSCNVACKHKQSSQILGPCGRRLTSRRSLDKPPSPSIQPVKAPTRTQNNGTTPSLKPIIALKTISDKPSKTVDNIKPHLSRTKSLPKGAIGVTKRTEANGSSSTPVKAKQKVRLLSVDAAKPESGAQEEKDQSTVNSPQSKTTEETSNEAAEKEQHQSPREGAEATSEDDNEQSEGSGESPGATDLSPHGGKAGTSIEAAPMRLKFKEREKMAISGEEMMMETESMALKKGDAKGKKEPPAGNDVIEEATKRMAEKRNKVKALVGAFETVMSLHEPEGQHGHGQQSPSHQVKHDQQHPKENKEDNVNLIKGEHQQSEEHQEEKADEVVVEAVEDANAEQEDEMGQHQKEAENSNKLVDVVAANDGQPVQHGEDNEDAKESIKSRENNGERDSSENNS